MYTQDQDALLKFVEHFELDGLRAIAVELIIRDDLTGEITNIDAAAYTLECLSHNLLTDEDWPETDEKELGTRSAAQILDIAERADTGDYLFITKGELQNLVDDVKMVAEIHERAADKDTTKAPDQHKNRIDEYIDNHMPCCKEQTPINNPC